MITIDLDENDNDNDDCILTENQPENINSVEINSNFKRKLILQVQRHRVLYDNKHKHFSDVAKKDLVWQQIASKLSSNATECKDIWYQLRYSYQCYARKLRNYFLYGHNKNLKRPAMGFESELIFLWRFVSERKTCEILFEIPENNNVGKQPKTAAIQKSIDDDIILVEEPVELIVIDEDDDNSKSDKQFKLSTSMKTLILLIKDHPELYDTKHPGFKDYTKKSYIWNAIANNLSDKATKLMKCWIVMQTRYEWELCHTNESSDKDGITDLKVHLDYFKDFIRNNPDTVYKQSYYLKNAWFDPIDYFKDIYNLIVRMKKASEIVYITDSLLNTPEKSKQYLSLWSEIANTKSTTAGQCETTWLVMRYFYWELMYMRQQNYQLTDKWYFETIITELYAISKAVQTAKKQGLELLNKKKTSKRESKRAAQTSATSQGAPSSKRASSILPAVAPVAAPPLPSLPLPTTMQMTPTIVNNLQIMPPSSSAQSTPAMQMTLPKITAAISLAPQSLNSSSLQIKQIPGPPNLSPAPATGSTPVPLPLNLLNGNATSAPQSTTMVPTQMSMSFNLPSQTKVRPVPMPSLLPPSVPHNTQPMVGNMNSPQISVCPQYLLKPPLPPVSIQITACSPTMNTNTNSFVNSPSPLNSVVVNNAAACNQSITSFTVATLSPVNTKTTGSANLPSATTTTMATTINSPNVSTDNQLPKITGAVSLLNPNEILIELIASQNGNHLLVHGPPLSAKYQLSMPMVAKFIREVLAIPLLHNKRTHQPTLINSYWEHISSKFTLPVHICRACWNFLQENFNHFPQIAPLKELMKPFQTSLNVWNESLELFTKFDNHCVSKGWLQYKKSLPDVVECIGNYPVLYKDIGRENFTKNVSEMETLCAWRTISLRFPKIPEIQEIWNAMKSCFVQYMNDLEFGIENKWPINWWRSLARLKFLVESRYTVNEPFFYIVSNKMLEEIDKCAMMEMKMRYKTDEVKDLPNTSNETNKNDVVENNDNNAKDVIATIMSSHLKNKKDVELGALINAIQKQPDTYNKADNITKYEAWKKVAQELNMDVPDCLFAFRNAAEKYFTYKKQDSVNRFRINERYYKKFDDIVRSLPSAKISINPPKINIKTPFELNQSVEADNSTNGLESVFPERYISDISMSNSPSNLAVKNWIFAIGNIPNFVESSHSKLHDILKKYLPVVKDEEKTGAERMKDYRRRQKERIKTLFW